jgi:hypothetical protein
MADQKVYSATHFFRSMAVPSVEEFRAKQCSRRLACLAAIIVVHVADQIVSAELSVSTQDVMDAQSKLTNALASKSEYFAICRDISNSTKHGRGKKVRPHLQNYWEVQQDRPGLFQAPIGQGYFAEQIKQIVQTSSGLRPVIDILDGALELLQQELALRSTT